MHATVDLGPGNLAGVLALEEEGLGLGAREAEGLDVSWLSFVEQLRDVGFDVDTRVGHRQGFQRRSDNNSGPRQFEFPRTYQIFPPGRTFALRPLIFASMSLDLLDMPLRALSLLAIACLCRALVPNVDNPISTSPFPS